MHLLVFNHIGQGQIGLALACVSLKGISFGRNPQRSCGGFFYGNSVCQYLLIACKEAISIFSKILLFLKINTLRNKHASEYCMHSMEIPWLRTYLFPYKI